MKLENLQRVAGLLRVLRFLPAASIALFGWYAFAPKPGLPQFMLGLRFVITCLFPALFIVDVLRWLVRK